MAYCKTLLKAEVESLPDGIYTKLGKDGINLSGGQNQRLVIARMMYKNPKIVIYEFIESLPEKYDTIIGEGGIKLSGGQKQRLAIARIILHKPDIIILDEATSSLDAITETKVLSNISELFKNKTLIIISHKPDLQIDFDDKIMVKDGVLTRAV